MSMITTAVASAGLSALGLHPHGHKKGLQADPEPQSTSAGSTNTAAPATTQGLFSSLLQTLEQVVGIPAITSMSPTPATPAANSLGGNVNVKV